MYHSAGFGIFSRMPRGVGGAPVKSTRTGRASVLRTRRVNGKLSASVLTVGAARVSWTLARRTVATLAAPGGDAASPPRTRAHETSGGRSAATASARHVLNRAVRLGEGASERASGSRRMGAEPRVGTSETAT
jgi:hypothetical protein